LRAIQKKTFQKVLEIGDLKEIALQTHESLANSNILCLNLGIDFNDFKDCFMFVG
jgi:hypothetical protein